MLASISFVVTFFALLLVERVLNAVGTLVSRLVYGPPPGDAVKGYASVQMLGAGVTYFSTVGASIVSLVSSVLTGLAAYLIWGLVLTFAFSLLFVVQEYYPEVLLQAVDYWNSFAGPFIHSLIVVPAQIVDIVFAALVPVYNVVLWIISKFFYNAIVTSAIRDLTPYVDIANGIGGFIVEIAVSLVKYTGTFARNCPEPVTDRCYEVGERTFDLITPMARAQILGVGIARLFDMLCMGLSAPIDIMIYPLLDINFAKGLHNIVNAILFPIIQIPSITYQRCRNNANDLIMCIPDFEPPYNMLSAGLRNIGVLIDNWLDVSSVIIQVCASLLNSNGVHHFAGLFLLIFYHLLVRPPPGMLLVVH